MERTKTCYETTGTQQEHVTKTSGTCLKDNKNMLRKIPSKRGSRERSYTEGDEEYKMLQEGAITVHM
jgi:hypothetical protein